MITILTSPGCQPCRLTKMALAKAEIDFEERNVADDPEALDLAKSLGYSSSPVVIAGDEHWSGFRPDLIGNLTN